ncbi:cytochrome bd oxidase small subunit CydS [Paenibacillus psychroresistens]
MEHFLIMIAPELVVVLSVAILFIWGARGKERI